MDTHPAKDDHIVRYLDRRCLAAPEQPLPGAAFLME